MASGLLTSIHFLLQRLTPLYLLTYTDQIRQQVQSNVTQLNSYLTIMTNKPKTLTEAREQIADLESKLAGKPATPGKPVDNPYKNPWKKPTPPKPDNPKNPKPI